MNRSGKYFPKETNAVLKKSSVILKNGKDWINEENFHILILKWVNTKITTIKVIP